MHLENDPFRLTSSFRLLHAFVFKSTNWIIFLVFPYLAPHDRNFPAVYYPKNMEPQTVSKSIILSQTCCFLTSNHINMHLLYDELLLLSLIIIVFPSARPDRLPLESKNTLVAFQKTKREVRRGSYILWHHCSAGPSVRCPLSSLDGLIWKWVVYCS